MTSLFDVSLGNSSPTEVAQYFNNIVSRFLTSVSSYNTDVITKAEGCFQSISQTYRKGLRDTGSRPNWSDNCNRCVYVHRFFALHSYLVYQSLQSALADKKDLTETWNDMPSFRVCCIGGGPGSDAVGLTKFLRDTKLVPTNRLECSIFDHHREWENTWQLITRSNSSNEFPPMEYFSGDMTRTYMGLNMFELGRVRSADVVSFVKFFSSVASFIRKDATRGNLLREIFRELKPGALVFYIDNHFRDQHGEFKRIASSGGVTDVLFENTHFSISMPVTERSGSSKTFDTAIEVPPLLSCNATVMLLRKPAIDKGENLSLADGLPPRTPESCATPTDIEPNGQPLDVGESTRPVPRYPVRANRGKPPNRFVPY